MRPIVVTAGPLASAAATAVCASQTPAAAGALTINGSLATGGVAYLGTAQRLAFASASNDSGQTFTITGTNWAGNIISETLTGPNATTVYSILDYLTVTSIVISAAATGAITVGTGQVGGSPWVRLDEWSVGGITIQVSVSGTVNYTVYTTNDDPNSPTNPVTPASINWISGSALANGTTTASANISYPCSFVRCVLNSGSGAAIMTVIQSGSATY